MHPAFFIASSFFIHVRFKPHVIPGNRGFLFYMPPGVSSILGYFPNFTSSPNIQTFSCTPTSTRYQ